MPENTPKICPPDMLENITFDELAIGQSAELRRRLTEREITLFAAVSGDVNPAHLNKDYAQQSPFHGVIGHGMWSGALISAVLGTQLPGPGTVYIAQDLHFTKPVHVNEEITARVTVTEKHEGKHVVKLACLCTNSKGETVLEGTATVLAPTQKLRVARPQVPELILPHDHYRGVMDYARQLGRIKVAVVHPVQDNVITAVLEAIDEQLMDPILIGPAARIKQACSACGVESSRFTIIYAEHSHAAAVKAAQMAATGEVDAIMKGSLHSDELLGAIVSSASGLRTERRVSHAYIMDIPTYSKPLIITDAAINIAPTLEEKADICRNAIDLWHVLFAHLPRDPKVAILSAVETVTSRMPSTLDAAALCKMADRGQISGGVLDGPLAFDNAISPHAAADKGITSPVAGDADILLVPNIETGNALAKQMIHLGQAEAAGIVLGARVPVILTSRADSTRTRLFSCAVAIALAAARRQGKVK